MSDKEIAVILLQLLDASTFPGSARRQVAEISAWLEQLESGQRTTQIFDVPRVEPAIQS